MVGNHLREPADEYRAVLVRKHRRLFPNRIDESIDLTAMFHTFADSKDGRIARAGPAQQRPDPRQQRGGGFVGGVLRDEFSGEGFFQDGLAEGFGLLKGLFAISSCVEITPLTGNPPPIPFPTVITSGTIGS